MKKLREASKKIDEKRLNRSICRLTGQIMNEPVIVEAEYISLGITEARGYTFEKEAIEKKFEKARAQHQSTIIIKINNEDIEFSVPEKDVVHGYNKQLCVNATKKQEIVELLTEYPEFYKNDCVYLPKAWQNSLQVLINTAQTSQDIEKHIQKIDTLLNKDPRLLTAKLNEKYSSFYLSCFYGRPELVLYFLQKLRSSEQINLIKSEKTLNVELKYANQLLRLLLQSELIGSIEDVHALLELGASSIQEVYETKNTLLHDLIIQGAINIDWLIKYRDGWGDSLFKIKNKEENTPLHVGIQHGQDNLVQKFLSYGDVNIQNNVGDTLLHLAVQKQKLKLVRYLLEAKAAVDTKNNNYHTPITIECQNIIDSHKWKATAILTLLVKDKAKLPPLHLAIELNDHVLLKTILNKFKIYLESENEENLTPLYLAVSKNNLKATKILVESGAILTNILPDTKETILHAAVQLGSNSILKYLFKNNKDKVRGIINLQDKQGNTALHFAVKFNNKEAIVLLIAEGAVEKENYIGLKPSEMIEDDETGKELKKKIEAAKEGFVQSLFQTLSQQQQQINRLLKQESEISQVYGEITDGSPLNQRRSYEEVWHRVLSDGNIALYTDGIIKIFDLKNKDTYVLNNANKFPDCILRSSNNNLIYANNKNNIIILSKNEIVLNGHMNNISIIQELYNTNIVSMDNNGVIKVWNLKNRECLYTINIGKPEPFQCFEIDTEQQILLCGSAEGIIQFWYLDGEPECRSALVCESDRIQGTRCEPPVRCLKIINSNLLAAGLDDGTILIFNIGKKNTGSVLYKLPPHNSGVKCIGLFDDQMISCCNEQIKLWDLNDFSCKNTFTSEGGKTFHLFISEIKNTLVTKENQITVTYDLKDFIDEQKKPKNTGWSSYVNFS